MNPLPKSYLPETEREGLTQNGVYLAEALAADQAGDGETSWAWLSCAELPAHSLLTMKKILGSQFIRDKGLRTEAAEVAYGKNWLDASL